MVIERVTAFFFVLTGLIVALTCIENGQILGSIGWLTLTAVVAVIFYLVEWKGYEFLPPGKKKGKKK